MHRLVIFLISASLLFIIVFGLLTVYTTQSVVFMPEIESEMMDQMPHQELSELMQSHGKTLGFMETLQFQITQSFFWSRLLMVTFWGVLVSTLSYGIAMKWGNHRK